MAAAIVRIVADEHIARPPVIVLEELQPVANRQLRDEHQMRRTDRHAGEPAMRIDDAAVALVRLVDDRRRRCATEMRRRLETDRLERATDEDRKSTRLNSSH